MSSLLPLLPLNSLLPSTLSLPLLPLIRGKYLAFCIFNSIPRKQHICSGTFSLMCTQACWAWQLSGLGELRVKASVLISALSTHCGSWWSRVSCVWASTFEAPIVCSSGLPHRQHQRCIRLITSLSGNSPSGADVGFLSPEHPLMKLIRGTQTPMQGLCYFAKLPLL